MILGPRWRKVFRDLWDNKSRTVLVVLAIAVGVFAFGGSFITQDVLLTDMDTQFTAVNPPGIIFYAPPFEEDLVRWTRSRPEVAEAQGRVAYSVQLIDGDEKINVDLYAVSDDEYATMHVNRIAPQEGAWPPGRREIVFERASAPVTGAQIGDTVLIELPNGRQRELEFTGTAHDLTAIPGTMWPQLSGYVTFETLNWLGYPATYNQLNIVAADGVTDPDELAVVADDLRDQLRHQGVLVNGVSVQDPTRHWAADVTEGFTAILSGLGGFSIILSAFLVINTITAVLAQQKRQIGMMKAVGASGGQITGIYIVMVSAFGLLSLIVALPAGAAMAYLSTSAVTNFLNIDILNFHIPPRVLLLEVLTALVAPILAALVPVLKGTRVTVREATSDYGLGTRRRRGLVDRLLARVRGVSRPLLLSLRNTFRRAGRLSLTLGTLTLAGSLVITVMNVRASLDALLDDILAVYNFDVQVALDDTYLADGLVRRALRVPGVTTAEAWSGMQAQRIMPDGSRGGTFGISGVGYDSTLLHPTIQDGRWLEPGDRNALVVSSEWLRGESDVEVGDVIVLEAQSEEREWEVVGVYLLPGDTSVYAPFDYVSRIQGEGGMAGLLLVGTEFRDGDFQTQVSRDMEEYLKGVGIGVSQTITRETIVAGNEGQFSFLVNFLLSMAVMVAAVGGLGLAGTMSLNVLERTREIGVMRALGASNGSLRGIVMVEGVLIGLMSWMLAVPLSVVMSIGFSNVLGLAIFEYPMQASFTPVGYALWLGLAIVISAIASLLPARRAARISVREALAYE